MSTSLPVTAVLTASAAHARQGVVHVPAPVLAGIGAVPGDVVVLRGARATSAIALLAPAGTDVRLVLLDELVLANLGIATGSSLTLSRVERRAAAKVVLSAEPLVAAGLDADLVRRVLLGKPLVAGDVVSLVPQDVLEVDDVPSSLVSDARRSVSNRVGPGWTSARLTVVSVSPSPGTVSLATELVLSAAGAAAPSVVPAAAPVAVAAGSYAPPATAARLDALRSLPTTSVPAQGSRTAPAAARSASAAAPAAKALVEDEVVPLADLPHLEPQAALLREWFDLGFNAPEVLARFGTRAQTGVLLSAPAGSGELDLVRGVAAELGASVSVVSGRLLASYAPQDALTEFRSALDAARLSAPAVVVVTDVDALVPREGTSTLVPSLLSSVEEFLGVDRVALVGLTSRPELVSPDLRRPGLLEHVVSAAAPDRTMRLRLLDHLVRSVPVDPSLSLDEVAARTPGFVLSDLRSLVQQASRLAARRARLAPLPEAVDEVPAALVDPAAPVQVDGQEELSFDGLEEEPTPALPALVTFADFDAALTRVKPSVMSGSSLQVGQVTLEDVGGMEDVKEVLTETVLWPLAYPDTFARMGVTPPRGVLLYGPPGCGKTFLVKAVASTGQANVFSVKGAELLTKWVGDSELHVRELFRKAREAAPSIVFLDEVDALAPQRGADSSGGVSDRVVASLLTELDGVEDLKNVVVIGATNRPDLVDSALLRPGRLEQMVFVPPPDASARAEILRSAAKRTPLADDVDLDALAQELDGFSSADCAALVRQAALSAMRESLETPRVELRHFVEARRTRVRPSLKEEQVAALERFASEHAAR